MKKVILLCFILAFFSVNAMAGHIIDSSENPKYLFVMGGTKGMIEEGKLTLQDVPLVVYFSDRPYRRAGHISLDEFMKLWEGGYDSFRNDPPNATLSVYKDGKVVNTVVELLKPVVEANAMTFNIKVIAGEEPGAFNAGSLFVDLVMTGGGPGPTFAPFEF